MFPDFVPIELQGMSIISALFFLFIAVGWKSYHTMIIRKEFTRISKKFEMVDTNISHLETKFETTRNNLADIKTNIALLVQSVNRIEKFLEKREYK